MPWHLRSCEHTLLHSPPPAWVLRPELCALLNPEGPRSSLRMHNIQLVNCPLFFLWFWELRNFGSQPGKTKVPVPTVLCWGWKRSRKHENLQLRGHSRLEWEYTGMESRGSWRTPFPNQGLSPTCLGQVWWLQSLRRSCLPSFLSRAVSPYCCLSIFIFFSLPFLSPCSFLSATTGRWCPWQHPCLKYLEKFNGESLRFQEPWCPLNTCGTNRHWWVQCLF